MVPVEDIANITSCSNCMATSMAPETPMMIFISKSIRQGAKRI